jgi:hypothetical protein
MTARIRLDHSIIAVSDWDVSNVFYRDGSLLEFIAYS